MTGKQVYLLGSTSEAARACIPLPFQQTAPRLVWKDGCWVAQFWYYALDSETMTVSCPQFYLELELPGGHPIEMKRLSAEKIDLGDGSDLLDPDFQRFLEDYLERCTTVLDTVPDLATLEKLWKKWQTTHPFQVARWLLEHVADPVVDLPSENAPIDPLLKKDPVAYWKKMQVQAIRAGDDAAAQKARLEMNKAEANRKK